MKKILVLTAHPDFAESVRDSVEASQHRVIHRTDLQSAEPLLHPQLLDACILDADLSSVQQLWLVEKLRRRLPLCPLLLFAATARPEWEEEAYLQGVSQVLAKPVRPRLLKVLLDRAWRAEAAPQVASENGSPPSAAVAQSDTTWLRAPPFQALETLSALRDFSAILGESLCAEALLRQFLLRLREVVGVNRSVVFLRSPRDGLGKQKPGDESRVLRSVCAVGVPASLLEDFELSVDTGIGAFVHRQGRILRRDHPEAQGDAGILREFELLGAQVAIPMFDRETLVGLALLDGRVTGEPLSNAELRILFHLLEAIGLAVKNIWLHDQLVVNHDMLADVLRQFSSGCVVVAQDLSILHANKAARAFFTSVGRVNQGLDFSDLPEALAGKVYQVLRSGTGMPPFRFEPPGARPSVYQVSIVPVQSRNAVLPTSALMVIEDQTQSEHLRGLEIEAANLRLVRQMADRLAHEVGNAMVPLSTHQQLFGKKYSDPEFRGSLDNALTEGVRRVNRLINQMRLLARDAVDFKEVFPVGPMLDEAFLEAQKHQPIKSAQLKHNLGDQALFLAGDRVSLKHAFIEVLLNALQADPANPRISVHLQTYAAEDDTGWVQIEVHDNGAGFTAETAARAFEPFYTTRNVGLGLGLVVSRKVVEAHRGRLEITFDKANDGAGVVRFSMPLAKPLMHEETVVSAPPRGREVLRKERVG